MKSFEYILGAQLIAFVFIMLKEYLITPKNDIKELRRTIQQNTVAISKLTVRIEDIDRQLSEVPRMKQDINSIAREIGSLRQ